MLPYCTLMRNIQTGPGDNISSFLAKQWDTLYSAILGAFVYYLDSWEFIHSRRMEIQN